jgi:hypothetical protein
MIGLSIGVRLMTDKPEQPSVAVQPQRNGKGQFLKGSQGLGGRKPGSRVKLEELFLNDMIDAWRIHGKSALERTADKQPAKFVAAAASILPKQTQNTRIHKLELMTDKELAELLQATDAQMEAAMIGRSGMN